MPKHQTDYMKRNDIEQIQYTPVTEAGQSQEATLCKRIGSTTYRVKVRFGEDCRETMDEKILRMVKSEVG